MREIEAELVISGPMGSVSGVSVMSPTPELGVSGVDYLSIRERDGSRSGPGSPPFSPSNMSEDRQ